VRVRLPRRMNRVLGGDTGSAAVWVVACAVLVLFVGLTVVLRESATLARHRAQGAADLAALAAAGQLGVSNRICAAATVTATANGARLVTCSPQPSPSGRSGTVDVVVSVAVRLPLLGARSAVARARAGRDPPQALRQSEASPAPGSASIAGVPASITRALDGSSSVGGVPAGWASLGLWVNGCCAGRWACSAASAKDSCHR